jgi:hypothetical protein
MKVLSSLNFSAAAAKMQPQSPMGTNGARLGQRHRLAILGDHGADLARAEREVDMLPRIS